MANPYAIPNAAALRAQAAAAVNASLPTTASITNPYNQSISDTTNFAKALMAQLGGEANTAGNAYSESLGDQATVNSAAQARLAALGPYAAGSQAAVGGLGDSATSRLLENRASAVNYATQMPTVAGARASLAQAALLKEKNQALQQRQDEYRSAYPQALQTAEDNALQRNIAYQNLGLQRQQLAATEAQNAASLAEQKREFGIDNSYRYAALALQSGGGSSSPGSALAKSLGLTPNELQSHVQAATSVLSGESPKTENIAIYKTVPAPTKSDPNATRRVITGYRQVPVQGSGSMSAVQAGVPFQTSVNVLIQHGYQPQVAIYAASQMYKTAKSTNFYAWTTFAQWMAAHGNAQYRAIVKRMSPNQIPNRGGVPPGVAGRAASGAPRRPVVQTPVVKTRPRGGRNTK